MANPPENQRSRHVGITFRKGPLQSSQQTAFSLSDQLIQTSEAAEAGDQVNRLAKTFYVSTAKTWHTV
ncbi:MAG: hypothetical protein ACK526_11690 [Planctomyces sp.]|jgi:hypothetical protein